MAGAPPKVDYTAGQTFHWHYGEGGDGNFQVHGHRLLVVIVIFSLAIFFAVVCVYVRWAWCGYRRVVVTTVGSTARSGGAATVAATSHQAPGLDKMAIEMLPVRAHVVVGVGEDAQCPICLSGLVDGEKVKVMPGCEHGFHPECVDPWLKSHPTCPLCRASLIFTSPPPADHDSSPVV